MLTVQTCLGFALTLPAIHLVPWLAEGAGWNWAFAILAVGPALGCVAMARLARPEARDGTEPHAGAPSRGPASRLQDRRR
jgi:dipeptide/tripeptide permease